MSHIHIIVLNAQTMLILQDMDSFESALYK